MIKAFFVSIILISFSAVFAQTDSSSINYSQHIKIVQSILKKYPDASLIDIYKYFFQSRFGPEHIISDSLIAFKILMDELKNEDIGSYRSKPDSLLVELLYPEKKFVRVDLSLIKERIIPINLFFTAFLQSAEKYDSIDYERWKNDWRQIVQKLESENIKIKNFREDKIKIESALKNNRLVFSHSPEYKKSYKPHYRVIEYRIFKEFLLPSLKQYRIKFIE